MLGNARQNTIVLLMPTKARDEDCKRDEFDDSLQSCSQIHSDASSGKKFQMQKQWKKNGETVENPAMAADESQKQKRGDQGSKK